MITIIIPTYNSAKTIKRCLDSIIAQTYKDYEVLVMDGVSKDDTLSLVQFYDDPRIHIYSEPDKGIYDAMNKGILKSKGEWLYFLGSDDYLYAPDVFEKVSAELDPKYKIVYGDVDATCLTPENMGEWRLEMIDYNRCHQAIFYNRSLFEKYGLYNTTYRLYADYMYNINCFWVYKVRTKYVNAVIAHYSDGGASSTGNDPQFYKDYSLIRFRYFRSDCTLRQKKELAREVIRNTDSQWMKIKMQIYVYYLRCVAKFQSLLSR